VKKVVVKILQCSVVRRTTLPGLTIYPWVGLQIFSSVYVPKNMKIDWQQTKLLQK